MDPLQKPTVSLKPDFWVFVRGEKAEFLFSGNYPGSDFSLYSDGEVITSQPAKGKNFMATFTPSEISAGNYWCKYTVQIERRAFTSQESEKMGITVWDPPQKPTISLNQCSGVFVRGEVAEISCSGNYPGSQFCFYKDSEFITTQAAPKNNHTSTFTPSEIITGNYWCKYTIHVGRRDLTSPESERVRVAVWIFCLLRIPGKLRTLCVSA